MRISDWSSDVCSSDLLRHQRRHIWKPAHPLAEQARFIQAIAKLTQITRTAASDRNAPQCAAYIGQSFQGSPHIAAQIAVIMNPRSDERRGGTEGVSTCSSRWPTLQ